MIERDSKVLGHQHLVRVYLPPGYHENTLRRYRLLYMQDGKNLFPEEAFLGLGRRRGGAPARHHERCRPRGDHHAGDRVGEYTRPGYEAYARSVVEEIKPEVDHASGGC